ncbi:hypothetical protein AB0G73_14280 [Streptomyces sp. NPDC020719]|uniref:hypothetical protein n=1 Tax=Streptomyces sp. NPDC020719 TaxID=3154896 RepID=UPI0033E56825
MNLELKDFQLDFGGLLLGHGTQVPIAEIEGLARPGVRGELVERPGADGAWASPDWYEARTLRIDCGIKTPGDPAAGRQILAALQQVADRDDARTVAGGTVPLRIKWPGSPVRALGVRVRKLDASWSKAAFGWIPLDIELVAPDPRFYSDVEQQAELRLGWLSGGGFTAPVQAPIKVTSGGPSGEQRPGWVTNTGTTDAYPVLTVHGPVANPQIRHVETGRAVDLQIKLAPSEWVRVDTRPGQRTVTRNNGGSVAITSPLEDFAIPPGRSEIRWSGSDPTASARLTVTWRDAHTAL